MTDQDNDTPPASPSWMQSQTKHTESTPPKSRKPRRTKAQMLAAQSNLGTESVLMTPAEYTQIDDHTVRLNYPPPIDHFVNPSPASAKYLIKYIPLAVSVLALITAIAALVR